MHVTPPIFRMPNIPTAVEMHPSWNKTPFSQAAMTGTTEIKFQKMKCRPAIASHSKAVTRKTVMLLAQPVHPMPRLDAVVDP